MERDIRLAVKAESSRVNEVFDRYRDTIRLLVNSNDIRFSLEVPEREGSIPLVGNGFEAFVYVKDVIDIEKELAKLKKELQSSEKAIARTKGKLSNPSFLDQAPPEVVKKVRIQAKELERRQEKIEGYIRELR